MNTKPVTVREVYAKYSAPDPVDVYSVETPNFYRLFNLVTNFDKMNNIDYIQYALVSIKYILL